MVWISSTPRNKTRGSWSSFSSRWYPAGSASFPLLLGLFPPSGVTGMVLNISSNLSSSVLSPSLAPHFPYHVYTSLSAWFSVFLCMSFLGLLYQIFFLAHALRPFSLRCLYHFSLSLLSPLTRVPLLLILSHIRF